MYKVNICVHINHYNVYSLPERKIECRNATAVSIVGIGRMSIAKASASHNLPAHGCYSSSGAI